MSHPARNHDGRERGLRIEREKREVTRSRRQARRRKRVPIFTVEEVERILERLGAEGIELPQAKASAAAGGAS